MSTDQQTAPTETDSIDPLAWRGVATEDDAERTAAEAPTETAALRLRAGSQVLLGSLLRPHRRGIAALIALLLIQSGAEMAGPFLVMLGIDNGIPPLVNDHDGTVMIEIAIAFGVSILLAYVGKRGFLVLSGRIGQAVLFDLRRRVFNHFQRLSIGFHERYTSGRVVARLTSDMDSISELVDGGIEELVLSALSVISIATILLFLDVHLALVTLLSFPFLIWLSRWFQQASAKAYRRTRETVALVIVQFVESMGGMRAVQTFRRESRNQEIFERVNDDYRHGEHESVPADRDVLAADQGDRQRHHRGGADLRRLSRAARSDRGRRARRVPALPAPVLRADAGPVDVLQLAAVGQRGAGEAGRRARRGSRGPGAGPSGDHRGRGRACRVRRDDLRLPAGPGRAPASEPRHTGRPDRGAGRRHRRRQVDDRQAGLPVLRPDRWRGAARWCRRSPV